MLYRIDDTRIQTTRPLIQPAILIDEVPRSEEASRLVGATRESIRKIILGEDDRLVVLTGPCSIHDLDAARDYASQLQELIAPTLDHLLVVMRVYFEKPRTTTGWKGLINDPDLDGTHKINKGLRMARTLLRDLSESGMPAATEFVDVTVPQHIADFISWASIGARTVESQTHRELASGLSMPVGFKNATDGRIQAAIDAVRAARVPHWFASTTKDGVAALSHSTGNDSCHVVLRGGSSGPNYQKDPVDWTAKRLAESGLPQALMIDFSHGNSSKDHNRQSEVCRDVAGQIAAGNRSIVGVMMESNIVSGRQDVTPHEILTYGQSITDACVSLADTATMLETLSEAVVQRRRLA
ncbi:MAG: 3-deoxy-7-phosphoheptulonate synthase [Fimbriimonadaceae bacterium]|jgi:3-deoxy-7-phosphoheptulonate synthase|nr:3-deoxy-7-phosphoheptulonate synthase [Fimbriimonadaceae bacterium]